MHEIITLQLGQRSNYLATHFWNTQESYFTYSESEESLVDHDIHFRPGLGADGSETFTPRTLIYDLKGGFGSLRKVNALYEIEEPAGPQGLWNGPTIIQRQAAIEQSVYQQSLDQGLEPPLLTTDSVRYWSDFNRVYFHPKSVIQLNEYELGSALMPFEKWSVGEDLFNSLDKEHDILDRDLRSFVEEADCMQGIQMIASVDDAWGGFAARYMDRIRDEFGKTTVYFWGLEAGFGSVPREKRFNQLSNTAKSTSEIAQQVSLFVPMTIPQAMLPSYVMLDPKSRWHVGGLLSTAYETMTLLSRLRLGSASRRSLDELVSVLNVNGNQNIAKCRMSIGQKDAQNEHLKSARLEERVRSRDTRAPSQERRGEEGPFSQKYQDLKPLDMDFFPTETDERGRGQKVTKETHVFARAEIFRADDQKENELEETDENVGHERARRRAAGLPIIQKSRVSLSYPLLDSFPHIFAHSSTASSLRVSTSLSTDTTVAMRMKNLQNIVSRAVGVDEREALGNSLGDLAEAYQEGWDSGTEDDDDD
ncbi:mtDNA inheritance, partitioning of the mitochondrial organelle [Cadophora gregata]|uniref:mtDNA inheritance, partitioning of the mitochondrial organelle n=1 Tax=Cadophora gregata TaxID=51156 RepID=UPI0026DBF209|nr:mtDNA inheritance, partitioning of the mitochondrial organelle [Cadophora gregata]KAK0113160.1 mtDNA inheritance, partitioning of the mitochondrial organelle [Cadophora gregata]KAK0125201.1 mtDNA inheritance, partitioning of the mitochondrial organelle [Cadophora gregata f. sp. sojae]